MRRQEKTERNHEILILRRSGAHYREIAEKFDISIIRVRQILEAQEAKEAQSEVIHEMHHRQI